MAARTACAGLPKGVTHLVRPQTEPKERKLEAHIVFFVGAGASKHLEFPLQKDFFLHATKLGVLHENDDLAKYLKGLGMDPCQSEPPGFEAAYSRADMQVMLGTRDAKARRPEFLDLIGKVYTKDLPLHHDSDNWKWGYDGLHGLLLQLMDGSRTPDTKRHRVAVLTTNYDLGFETACLRTLRDGLNGSGREEAKRLTEEYRKSLPENRKDELLELELWNYWLPNRRRSENPLSVPLLKLHGSVNWGICPDCEQVTWTPCIRGDRLKKFADQKRVRFRTKWVHDTRCQYHAEDKPPSLQPLLVPPTWSKWIGDFTMRFIWRQAYSALRSCSHLIFIGFSLPDEDLHIRELLMAGLAEKKERKVSVYDCCLGQQAEGLKSRYRTLLQENIGIPMKCKDFHLGQEFEESYDELAQDLRLATRSVF